VFCGKNLGFEKRQVFFGGGSSTEKIKRKKYATRGIKGDDIYKKCGIGHQGKGRGQGPPKRAGRSVGKELGGHIGLARSEKENPREHPGGSRAEVGTIKKGKEVTLGGLAEEKSKLKKSKELETEFRAERSWLEG